MKIHKILLCITFLAAFVLCLLSAGYAHAGEDGGLKLKPGQPIIVNGDKVEYREEDGSISAEGNVSITYGDVTLKCERIEVNTKTKQALCEGNVVIEQPDGTLRGDRIRYDFDRERGELISGEMDAFPWFGNAEETGKVGDNEYLLRKGYVTTCDLDKPHYRVQAREIRVFPGEKVIAKNVLIFIGDVPVMWFPYYYHPVIQSRAKVQFIPGYDSKWGYFLLSAWRFYISGNTKVDVLVDYRDKKGFAEGANLYYNTGDLGLPGLGHGLFRSYFIQQNDLGTNRPEAFRDEGNGPLLRKRFQWQHRIDFDPGTVGMLEFNKMSDEYVLEDYFYNEYEENAPVPPNYVNITSVQRNYTFSLKANHRFNSFYTVVERMPEFKLEVPDQRLWGTPFYYGTETSATVFSKQYEGESSPPEYANRFDSQHKLSYVTGLGPVRLTPYGTIQETVYNHTRWDGRPVLRTAFGGGLNASSRFHRIYDVKTDALGLDINGLRHIVVPGAEYFHTHQPTVDKNNLFQMDEIDGLEKRNGVTLLLENKLQTKRGFEGEMKAVDLARFVTSVDYLFRMKKDRFEMEKNGQFRNLNMELELRPYDWLYIDSEMEIFPKNQAIKTGSLEATLHPWESFWAALGYRYEKKPTDPRNQLTFDIRYELNPKWTLGLYERFDIEGGKIEEQQISIVRDLHCWEVEFVYDVKGSNFMDDEFTVWMAFKIKAFPDLQLGLSRSFTKRPPGSLPEPQ